MLFWCSYLTTFPPPTFLSGVHRHFLLPRRTSSTSLYLRDIHQNATSFGGSTAYFPEQLVCNVTVKRRSVAGVDQEELLDPEHLADHDSLFFEINGVKIHHKACDYDVVEEEEAFQGKVGFPAILLHGFGASVFSWGRIMKSLAYIIGSKVLAFDRPAFGLTSRASYIENPESGGRDNMPLNLYSMTFSVLATLSFVDMLGSEKAILIGHSAGGLVAVNTYFESPERVAALILVAPAIFASLLMKKKSKYGAVWKEKKEEDGAFNMNAVEDPFSRIWRGVLKLYVMIASILFGMLNRIKDMISSLFAKAVAALLRSILGVVLVRIVMDKFGILAVKNAWYNASRVTDDVINGYTKPLRAKGWERALLEYTIAMLISPASKPMPPLSKKLSEITCPGYSVYEEDLTMDLARFISSQKGESCCVKEMCCVYIENLCKLRNLSGAVYLLRHLHDIQIHPGLHTYNTVLAVAGEAKSFDIFCDIFQKLLLSKVPPDLTTYLNVAKALLSLSDSNELLKFIRLVSKITGRRDPTVVNRIIFATATSGQIDKSLMMFEELKVHECKLDTVTFNTVLAILGRAGQVDKMLSEYSLMKELGYSPDTVTYDTLVNCLRRLGRLDLCKALAKEMLDAGRGLDLQSYTALIDGLGRAGHVDDALILFAEMKKFHRPSVYVYRAMIANLRKFGKMQAAIDLLEEMNSSATKLVGPEDFRKKRRDSVRERKGRS